MTTRTAMLKLIFVLASCIHSTLSAGQDSTLVDGAHGEDVVNAVVNKIRSRCLFSEDRLFLRRAAFVVSEDGDDPSTYRPGYNGGIWQIDEVMFEETKKCSSPYIASQCSAITKEFGITWSSVTWSDLRKPLYSGIAATLYTLLQLRDQPMPGSIIEQAQVWAAIYSLSNNIFSSRAAEATKMACSDEMDLVFILDSSGSVSYSDFSLMRAFASDVVDVMDVGPNAVRVADVVFGSTVVVEFDFQRYTSKTDIRSGLNSTRKLDGGTATNKALDAAASLLYDPRRGARQGVKKVAVLVTDGQSDSLQRTNASATYLKNNGTTVVAVGIGSYNLVELQAVASKPTCTNVFTLPNFAAIRSILYEIQKSSCEASNIVKTDPVNVSIKSPSTVTTFETTSGDNLEFEVTCGILEIYVSYTDTKPGPVIYDEMYRATDDSPLILSISESLPQGTIVYITVVSTRLPEAAARLRNCKDYKWILSRRPESNLIVVCEKGGVKRECTKEDIQIAGVCKRGEDINDNFQNPCTPSNLANGVLRHPYPYDSTKFLQCDLLGNAYVTACPNGVAFNTKSRECGFTSPCNSPISGGSTLTNGFSNPCTKQAIANKQFYFAYTPDKTKFIQCDVWGSAFLRPCGPGTEWSQRAYTCVHQVVGKTNRKCARVGQFLTDPCDHHAFLVCDAALQPRRQLCGPTLFFNPKYSICDFTDVQPAGGC